MAAGGERILTQRELNRALLARQLLLERVALPLPRVVDRLGGIQNQYAPNAYIRLWSCVEGFRRADLTGVKTIHFARWVFQDDYRRLLFCSNYDGSLESYMDDFIDKVAWGLNAVFSNGVGYPRTRWLVLDGAKRELEFKDFLRRRQLPTQVWYQAYPQLTALNIENNARIRAALWAELSESEIAEWLRRF